MRLYSSAVPDMNLGITITNSQQTRAKSGARHNTVPTKKLTQSTQTDENLLEFSPRESKLLNETQVLKAKLAKLKEENKNLKNLLKKYSKENAESKKDIEKKPKQLRRSQKKSTPNKARPATKLKSSKNFKLLLITFCVIYAFILRFCSNGRCDIK